MVREELISEISMRRDIPIEDVEEVLEERDVILAEECHHKKRKKRAKLIGTALVFTAGVAAAMLILDRKDKIDIDDIEDMVKTNVKKYTEKYTEKCMDMINSLK